MRGWQVAKPFGEMTRYDVIVDTGTRLLRVQIKSTSKIKAAGSFTIRLCGGSGVKYTSQECDVIACYVEPRNQWFLIPVGALRGRGVHAVLGRRSQYARYLDAWDDLAICKPWSLVGANKK